MGLNQNKFMPEKGIKALSNTNSLKLTGFKEN